jgi:hypothetical protein
MVGAGQAGKMPNKRSSAPLIGRSAPAAAPETASGESGHDPIGPGSAAARHRFFRPPGPSDRVNASPASNSVPAALPLEASAAALAAAGAAREAARARARRLRAIATVARDTLLEALRGRWLWMGVASAVAVAVVAGFAQALALTEAHSVGLSFAAPLARLLAVLLVTLGAATSVVREQSERTLLIALAAPMSRTTWLAGKYLGLATMGGLTALLLAVPVAGFGADGAATAAWIFSLALELALVAAVALAVAMAVPQIPPAVCAVLAFYVLARDGNLLLLLAQRAEDYSAWSAAGPLVQAIALLLPRLDLFTRTDWLLGTAPSPAALGLVAAHAATYCLLSLSAAALDLRRRRLP